MVNIPPPTNGLFWTNVTFVYTNVAVVTPTIVIPNCTVYNATNSLKPATVLSWDNNPDPLVVGSKVYYGSALGTTTNVYTFGPTINCVAFYKMMATNAPHWAYVTAFSSTGLESEKSNIILFTPR